MDRIRRADLDDAVRVYAVIPYRVTGLTLDLASGAERGHAIRYGVKVGGADGGVDHVLRVEVTDARADKPWYHQKNVTAVGGTYAGTIPIAMNAPTGRWRVRVTDVISGESAEGTCGVK